MEWTQEQTELRNRIDALLGREAEWSMETSGYTAMVEDMRKRLGVDDDPDYPARDTFEDIANHGTDTGWGGFTYTSECVEFFDAHEAAIMELAQEDADSFGYANVAELVATFTRADMADTMDGYKNLMAWYALETVARRIADDE